MADAVSASEISFIRDSNSSGSGFFAVCSSEFSSVAVLSSTFSAILSADSSDSIDSAWSSLPSAGSRTSSDKSSISSSRGIVSVGIGVVGSSTTVVIDMAARLSRLLGLSELAASSLK